jgi:hypothetical protein
VKPRVKFLLTVAAALGNLVAAQAEATVLQPNSGVARAAGSSSKAAHDNQMHWRVKNEVLRNTLILKKSIGNSFSVGHRSHMSHRSHSSHRSHTSAR